MGSNRRSPLHEPPAVRPARPRPEALDSVREDLAAERMERAAERMERAADRSERAADRSERAAALLLECLDAARTTPWMKVGEAAEYTRFQIGQFRHIVADGGVPRYKPGKAFVYHRDELDAWMREHRYYGTAGGA